MKDEGSGRQGRIAVMLVLLCVIGLILPGCKGEQHGAEVLARVGNESLTSEGLARLAGKPVDSLSSAQRWRMVQTWVERSLIEQEGKRRGWEGDQAIKEQLASVRAELYRTRLLSEFAAPAPSDTAVREYYSQHRNEFLRPVDAYLIELYWGELSGTMARFREQLSRGDTSMLAAGEVTSEGRWLAEKPELGADMERELSTLKPGEVTFPRPYEDGFRVVRLVEKYPAGTVLDQSAVEDDIRQRLVLQQSYRRQDSLLAELQRRIPVKIFLKDGK